jgi:hypothetical protein
MKTCVDVYWRVTVLPFLLQLRSRGENSACKVSHWTHTKVFLARSVGSTAYQNVMLRECSLYENWRQNLQYIVLFYVVYVWTDVFILFLILIFINFILIVLLISHQPSYEYYRFYSNVINYNYTNITITILDIIHRSIFYLKLNSTLQGLSIPHRKHITSPLWAQQVNTTYRVLTMVYWYNYQNSGHQGQGQGYITTNNQSVSMSWYRAQSRTIDQSLLSPW